MTLPPLPTMVFAVEVFALVNFDNDRIPVVINPSDFARIILHPRFALIPKKITPVDYCCPPVDPRLVHYTLLRLVVGP